MTTLTFFDTPHSTIYNVQPTSDTTKSRTFPTLPYSEDNPQFINKPSSQFSDLTDTEHVTLCSLLVKHKKCYATHKKDVCKIATPIRIRSKPNAQLLTQRPSEVPYQYPEKLKNLHKELEKQNIIKQIGSSPEDKPNYGTTYLIPLIIIPKGDSIKGVLDARHLNSYTEQSDESWPQVINFSYSSEVFMDLKDYQISLQNKRLPSLNLLQNKALPSCLLMTFNYFLTLENICSNLLNNFTL